MEECQRFLQDTHRCTTPTDAATLPRTLLHHKEYTISHVGRHPPFDTLPASFDEARLILATLPRPQRHFQQQVVCQWLSVDTTEATIKGNSNMVRFLNALNVLAEQARRSAST